MSKLTDEQKIELVEKYKKGATRQELSVEYSIDVSSVRMLLKRRNVPNNRTMSEAHRKYTINEHYFDVIDSEEKAYFLGLLYADGCNAEYANEIIISLQHQDRGILEDFSRAVGTNKPLSFKDRKSKNPNWSDVSTMSICSKIMSTRLAELGCFQKKSLTLKFPTEEQVPTHLLRHFIRGYFDGDGCICAYKKPKENRYQTTISFVSTLDFCNSLGYILKNTLNINCIISKRHKNRETTTRQLIISGNNVSLKLCEWIYNEATVFLERKYEKYCNIKEGIETLNALPRWEEYSEGQRIRINLNGEARLKAKEKL